MSVAVLSFSRIARDRRVLRQCALLAEMGQTPAVIAYADEGETIAYPLRRWPVPRPTVRHRLTTLARQVPAHLGLAAARAGFWVEPRHRWALAELEELRPALVIANDWPALVVAAAYKARSGVRLHYDSHEFATLEFDESPYWRLVYKPMVTALEGANIGAADSVSTVGPGLAEALQRRYGLPAMPLVIRSVPEQGVVSRRSTCEWPMQVLFHGQLMPDRGIEAVLHSMPSWQVPHRLLVRGDGALAYATQLKALARSLALGNRVEFEPAVAPADVVPRAAESDLGVFFTPLRTGQHHFNLPNKLFEYIAAGLAVAVSPGADLKQTVEAYKVGVVSADAGPEAIADVINGLTRDRVVAFKAAARVAADTLCWEHERNVLRLAVEHLLTGGR